MTSSPAANDVDRRDARSKSRGQALVELTLVIPITALIFLGIVDMARVFVSQIAVESAAREAADFGSYNSDRWIGDASDPNSNFAKTTAAMIRRACIASIDLPDYAGAADGTSCTNPSISVELVNKNGTPASNCDQADRNPGPCWVQVTANYAHGLIIPLGMDYFDTRLGLPDQLSFSRTSVFAISDFSVDEPAP